MALRFKYKPGQLPSQTATQETKTYAPALAIAGETPEQFGRRMIQEGTKTYDDVLNLITHLNSRVAASEMKALKNWKQSLEGAKAEFDDKEISQADLDATVKQIYDVLRKNYPDDFTRSPVRGGRKRRQTKRSKRIRRKTAKK